MERLGHGPEAALQAGGLTGRDAEGRCQLLLIQTQQHRSSRSSTEDPQGLRGVPAPAVVDVSFLVQPPGEHIDDLHSYNIGIQGIVAGNILPLTERQDRRKYCSTGMSIQSRQYIIIVVEVGRDPIDESCTADIPFFSASSQNGSVLLFRTIDLFTVICRDLAGPAMRACDHTTEAIQEKRLRQSLCFWRSTSFIQRERILCALL